MRQVQHVLSVSPDKQGLLEITGELAGWLDQQPVRHGMLTAFIRHTSASLLIQENADPDVARDLESFFDKLAPEDLRLYRHTAEGPDDMPAHLKGALTQTCLAIPVRDGKMLLGTYQGVFVFEHRKVPRTREIVLHLVGQ